LMHFYFLCLFLLEGGCFEFKSCFESDGKVYLEAWLLASLKACLRLVKD
jgi:hypothetical protein